MPEIKWIPTLVGALVPMFLGFIWYHPKLFGTRWMQAVGMTPEDAQKANMPVVMGVSLVMSAMMAYWLSAYMGFHPEEEQVFTHGLFHGGLFAVLIGMPVLVTNSLFEQRSAASIVINTAYWLVTISVMGGVVALLV